MSRRKNRDPGGAPKIHQTRSFEQLVAEATQAKLAGYIDSEINGVAQALAQKQQRALRAIFQRIISIEQILMETVPGLNKDGLATRLSIIEDEADGYEAATDGTALGDRVRLELKTKTADQAEFQGSSRLQIDNVGTGNTLGKELESAMLGLKVGDTKEIKFGKDESLVASITMNRVSRLPKEEDTAEQAATEESTVEADSSKDAAETVATEAVAAPTQETASASANAG